MNSIAGELLRCSGCKSNKPFAAFFRNKSRKSGYGSYCKVCMKKYYDKDESREASRRSHLRHKARRNAEMRERAWRVRGLNLTLEAWEKYLDVVGRQCEIVGCPEIEQLSPDHDHVTGELRGVLCRKHNRALGMFEDKIEGLERAIVYLVKAQERINYGK